MNKPNHLYPIGVNSNANRPKLYYRDMQKSQSNDRSSTIYTTTPSPLSYYFPTPPIYGNHLPQFTSAIPQSDSVICDGMNNCHLTDSWVNYMNQHVNLPITQITNQIPILNSYIPTALRLPPFFHQNYAASYHPNYLESIYERRKSEAPATAVTEAHPQQILCDGILRRVELNYEASTNDHPENNKSESNKTIYDDNSTLQRRHSKVNNELYDDKISVDRHASKMCIKFQDRNKKLDFKKNFRDENRKINGCFYDSENDLSPKMRNEGLTAAPPKKKWIQNYMTTFAGT